MRRLNSIVLILFLITGSSFSEFRKSEYKIRTVVIDAGHGGHDSGCLGSSSKEKHIALSIALKLGKMIEENIKDVKVVYTRKTDVFIALHERAAIANKHKADLFICIHCNSGANKSAYGAETYVMGLHKTAENLAVARRENAAVLLEDDYKMQYEGFDPNSPEANIIFSLYQNQFLNQSLAFASNVQNQMVEYSGRHNRGVKQAGFLVLFKTSMPGVLIETGFLSNDAEEKYLSSDKGQNSIATSIFRAFKEYKIDSETPYGTYSKPDNRYKDIDPDTVRETPKAPKIATSTPPTPVVIKENNTQSNTSKESTMLTDSLPEKKDDSANYKTSNSSTKPDDQLALPKDDTPQKVKDISLGKIPDIYITIQIGASTNPDKDGLTFAKVAGVMALKGNDGFTRYLVGRFKTVEGARKKQEQLKSDGYKDCFLSAYHGDKKIAVSEAVILLKNK